MNGHSQRVMVYVDGFNLYHGLRDKGWQRYYWLDLRLLSENLLRSEQTLASVRYFTARIIPVKTDPDKARRQTMYLEALDTLPDLHIHYGRYRPRTRRCRRENDRCQHRGRDAQRRSGQRIRYCHHRVSRRRLGWSSKCSSQTLPRETDRRRLPAKTALSRSSQSGDGIIHHRP